MSANDGPHPIGTVDEPAEVVAIDRRRACFDGPGRPFRHERDAVEVDLATGEVLVAIRVATICGSDLHSASGRRAADVPSVLGHEAIGDVVAVGRGRTAELVGQRVTWTLIDSCGQCQPCTTWGLPQKCAALFKYGHAPLDDGHGLNGCFASHIVLRAGTTVLPVPDSIPDELAASANCALATSVAVVESVPASARRVLVQGAGLLGVYAVALLRDRGVDDVMISDVDDGRIALAQRFGAVAVAADHVASIDDGSVDAVVEVAGTASVVGDGLRVLRPGGTYVLAGMVHPDTALALRGVDIVTRCLTIIGVHNYAPRHLRAAIDVLAEHAGDGLWAELVSPPLPLARLDEAFAMAAARRWPRIAVRPT